MNINVCDIEACYSGFHFADSFAFPQTIVDVHFSVACPYLHLSLIQPAYFSTVAPNTVLWQWKSCSDWIAQKRQQEAINKGAERRASSFIKPWYCPQSHSQRRGQEVSHTSYWCHSLLSAWVCDMWIILITENYTEHTLRQIYSSHSVSGIGMRRGRK